MLREALLEVLVDVAGDVVALLLRVIVRRQTDRRLADEVALRIEVRHLHVLLGRAVVVLQHLEAERLVVLAAGGILAFRPGAEDLREAREGLLVERGRLLHVLRVLRLGRELLIEVREEELALHDVRAVRIVLQRLLEDELALVNRCGGLLGLLQLAVFLRLLEQALRKAELHQHGRVTVREALREEADVAVRAAEDRTGRGQRPRRRARERHLVVVREDHLVTVADGEAVLGQNLVRGRDTARDDGRNRLARRKHDRTKTAREDTGVRHRLREDERTLDARLGGNRKGVDLVRLVGRVAVGVVNLHEEALADVRLVALRGERAVRKA